MAFVAPLIPLLPTLLTAGSAVVGATTAIQNGEYQAGVAMNNARIAEANAARTSEASQRESMRSDQNYRALLGEQLAAQGASGFDILGRSQRAARVLTERTGRLAALDITKEGTAAARRSLQEGANFRGEGNQARLQGYLTGASTLLQGASDVGTMIRGRRPMSFERRRTR